MALGWVLFLTGIVMICTIRRELELSADQRQIPSRTASFVHLHASGFLFTLIGRSPSRMTIPSGAGPPLVYKTLRILIISVVFDIDEVFLIPTASTIQDKLNGHSSRRRANSVFALRIQPQASQVDVDRSFPGIVVGRIWVVAWSALVSFGALAFGDCPLQFRTRSACWRLKAGIVLVLKSLSAILHLWTQFVNPTQVARVSSTGGHPLLLYVALSGAAELSGAITCWADTTDPVAVSSLDSCPCLPVPSPDAPSPRAGPPPTPSTSLASYTSEGGMLNIQDALRSE
jgi:hypothetical protein